MPADAGEATPQFAVFGASCISCCTNGSAKHDTVYSSTHVNVYARKLRHSTYLKSSRQRALCLGANVIPCLFTDAISTIADISSRSSLDGLILHVFASWLRSVVVLGLAAAWGIDHDVDAWWAHCMYSLSLPGREDGVHYEGVLSCRCDDSLSSSSLFSILIRTATPSNGIAERHTFLVELSSLPLLLLDESLCQDEPSIVMLLGQGAMQHPTLTQIEG